LVRKLDTFHICYIPREENKAANGLAQQASGYDVRQGKFSVRWRPISCNALDVHVVKCESAEDNPNSRHAHDDWRRVIQECIKDPSSTKDWKLHCQALRYTILDGKLYRRTVDGLLLKCLGDEQAKIAMGEVHEGLCGTHQSAHKMKWMLKRAGLFWPTMVGDCFKYFKGCEACQRFGDI
jgi:hypothetical protein